MIASSLRSRLFISYVVVIFVCLVLVTLSLIFVARPIQERLTTARLATQLALTAPLVRTLLQEEPAPARAMDALARRADRRDMRMLVVDRDGRVLGDTSREWLGQRLAQLAAGADAEGRVRGAVAAPDGTRVLYAAASISDGMWLVFVTSPPVTSPGLFGDLGEGLLAAGGIALVFSVLLAVRISRSVAGPTRRMAQVAEAIASGDYDQQLDIREPKEMRVLAESLEAMARQVKASQQSMRDLVANVSHDLRTPLTSVQGFAQALMEGVTRDEEAQRRAARVIYEEASRTVRMVEELADLALIESGQLKLVRQPLDLTALIEHVVQTLSETAREKGVQMAVEVAELPDVLADHDRLVQVFANLVGNAVKYTPGGGRVQVKAQRVTRGHLGRERSGHGGVRIHLGTPVRGDVGSEWAVVSVIDNGRGIPAEDLSRVFERFYRVDRARTARRGYGLGLAIAKEIVEAHGGWIGVESVEGVGSRFIVELPMGSAAG